MEEEQLEIQQTPPTSYKKKVILIAIIIAWVLLFICFIFKLFGSKVFNIVIHNQDFIEACNWLDNDGEVYKYILAAIMYLVSTPFIVLASALHPSFKTKWMFIIMPSLCVVWVVKFFHSIAGTVLEAVVLVVIPCVMSRKWWTGFVGYALDFIFQLLSLYIRGQDMRLIDSSTLITLILSIDYYIMIALFYLYVIVINNRKRRTN